MLLMMMIVVTLDASLLLLPLHQLGPRNYNYARNKPPEDATAADVAMPVNAGFPCRMSSFAAHNASHRIVDEPK